MGKQKEFEWVDRCLMRSPYHIALCVSEEGFHKVLKQLKLPKKEWPVFIKESFGACVYTFENEDGTLIAIVNMEKSKRSKEEIYPLLVHEAQHVLEHVWEFLGETKPSSELLAYSIQNISQNLMESYKRQTSTKKGKK